jgi:hypothetical protein
MKTPSVPTHAVQSIAQFHAPSFFLENLGTFLMQSIEITKTTAFPVAQLYIAQTTATAAKRSGNEDNKFSFSVSMMDSTAPATITGSSWCP